MTATAPKKWDRVRCVWRGRTVVGTVTDVMPGIGIVVQQDGRNRRNGSWPMCVPPWQIEVLRSRTTSPSPTEETRTHG